MYIKDFFAAKNQSLQIHRYEGVISGIICTYQGEERLVQGMWTELGELLTQLGVPKRCSEDFMLRVGEFFAKPQMRDDWLSSIIIGVENEVYASSGTIKGLPEEFSSPRTISTLDL